MIVADHSIKDVYWAQLSGFVNGFLRPSPIPRHLLPQKTQKIAKEAPALQRVTRQLPRARVAWPGFVLLVLFVANLSVIDRPIRVIRG
jgi:hypothetical protein